MTPHDAQYTTVTLPDGRTLEFQEGGVPDGAAVVLHHGTPGSSLLPGRFDAAATERGLRLVAPSRSGYGSSTRDPGRDVVAAAGDTAALCDALGVGRFATLGWSGGGPHALACAAVLASRCVAAVSLAGVAPYDPAEFDWLEGMAPSNVEEFKIALEGGPAYDEMLVHHREALLSIDPTAVTSVGDLFGDLVGPADLATATEEDARLLASNLCHGLGPGAGGWRDDDQAFLRDWGFDVRTLDVPVAVWYGAGDLMVPPTHGDWLAANARGARARRLEDDGHLSVGLGRFGEALDELASLAGGSW